MLTHRNILAALCAMLIASGASGSHNLPSEDEKIERLIRIVAELKDATFIRNGKEHDCQEAAKHMRDKWEHGKDQIKTAGEFIEKAASRSMASGKPYTIRFNDGREVESGAFLRDELKKIEGGETPPGR